MFGSPVMPKFVSGHQISFTSYDSLTVVVPGRAQAGVQVESVAILEVLCEGKVID
jgi:hypothetical protein